jgi:tetratricopeptide (TPR) repeat protein
MINQPSSGRIVLSTRKLKLLRERHGLSQEKMADLCQNKKIRISLSSIKRAEMGNPVLYRVAAELAKFHNKKIDDLIDLGYKKYEEIQTDKSIESFAKPCHSQTIKNLLISALSHYDNQHFEKALPLTDTIIHLTQGTVLNQTLHLKGKCLLALGYILESQTYLEEAARHEENFELAQCYWLACIRAYILNEDTEKAMTALDKMNELMHTLQHTQHRLSSDSVSQQNVFATDTTQALP